MVGAVDEAGTDVDELLDPFVCVELAPDRLVPEAGAEEEEDEDEEDVFVVLDEDDAATGFAGEVGAVPEEADADPFDSTAFAGKVLELDEFIVVVGAASAGGLIAANRSSTAAASSFLFCFLSAWL